MEMLHLVHAGERQPVHHAGDSPEYCIRPRRAGEIATFRIGQYEWVFCGQHNAAGCAAGIAALRQRRPSQHASAAPFYRDNCGITASPLAAEEERDCAALRQRPASQDAPPFYRGNCPSQATSAAPTTSLHHDEAWPRSRAHLAAEEEREQGATLHQRRASQDGDSLISAYAPLLSTTAALAPRDHDESHAYLAAEEGKGSTHHQLRASVDEPEADGPTAVDSRDGGRRVTEDARRRSAVGDLRAATDIFLVQERTGGVPPSRLHTIPRVPCGYWIAAAKRWIMKTVFRRFDPDVPMAWSWVSILGPAVYQPQRRGKGDGSCVICACAVCIHAQHRLAFERRYGAGSFPFELSSVDYLKRVCQATRTWVPWGAQGTNPEAVLAMIKDELPEGLRTNPVPGWRPCDLPFSKFLPLDRDGLEPLDFAGLMREFGPVVGSLRVNESYSRNGWDDQYVYPGEDGDPNHAVVCVEYCIMPDSGELRLRVLENVRQDGPLRWVLFEAFTRFFFIQVDALKREALVMANAEPSFVQKVFFSK